MNLYIPENSYYITERYYSLNEICDLLRAHRFNPEIVRFIADMLEE